MPFSLSEPLGRGDIALHWRLLGAFLLLDQCLLRLPLLRLDHLLNLGLSSNLLLLPLPLDLLLLRLILLLPLLPLLFLSYLHRNLHLLDLELIRRRITLALRLLSILARLHRLLRLRLRRRRLRRHLRLHLLRTICCSIRRTLPQHLALNHGG